MPTPAFYIECDYCTAGYTWTAHKDDHELHFCRHHADQHKAALIAAGFIMTAARVPV